LKGRKEKRDLREKGKITRKKGGTQERVSTSTTVISA